MNKGFPSNSCFLQNPRIESVKKSVISRHTMSTRYPIYGDARRLPSSRRRNIISLAFKQVGHAAVPGFTQDDQCTRILEIAVAVATVPVRMHTARFQLIFRHGREPCAVRKSARRTRVCAHVNIQTLRFPAIHSEIFLYYELPRQVESSRVWIMSFYSAIFSGRFARALPTPRKLLPHFRRELLYKGFWITFSLSTFPIFHP